MMKRFYIIILFLAFALKVSSQVYPVSVMVNLTPPYPSTLDGFADISSNKISLQITVNDLTLSGYPVKLRLVMKSNSVTITTSQAFITNPILINGGESIILTSADLAEYFRLENLDFSGFSKNQYLKTGQLPDGIYQITFEVVDYHRNFVISSSRFPAFAYIFVNDPPILNMPFDRAQINITGQQNILFNWTFRHSPFSRPGFIPEYRFEMWEVYPENMDTYAVALATQPVYSTTVNSTTFNYTVMEPSLIPGRKYAWRVTVIDPEGITAFKEGGRSALRWFQYGTACDAPLIKAGAIGASHINVEWETKQYQTNFKINYKPVNMEGGDWYSGTTSMQNFRIENLRPNTEYYVEVKGTCGTQESPASERLRLRTKQDLTFECGNPGNIPEITNRNPLMQLKRGDYIKAGDFEVEIYEAQGSNGTFSGKGFILVPLFKFIKLEADLNNIQVNTDYQLMGGSIKTVYNLSNSLMLNMTDIFGGGSLMKKENNPFADIADIKINAPDSIQSVIISGNSVVVNTAQGTVTESVSEDKIVAITAPSGKQYVVDGATKTVYAQSTPSGAAPSKGVDGLKQPSDSEKKFVVDFDASGQQIYGFDKPDVQNMPADNYKTRITNGQMAYVPWKSVESGRFDRLDAIINGEPADSVFFSRQSRNMVMVSKGTDDSRRSLLISGGNNNDEDELYAWYTYNGNEQDTNKNIYYAGSVNIVSYDQISADLCLVSVNGSAVPADKAAVEAFLNKVYASAVAKWNVTYLEGGLSVTLESGSGKKIDNTDPDDRMDYTPDMKLVNRAMKDHPAYNRHTVYLFFFDQGTDAALAGYMPLNGQFGYITGYTAARQAEYYRTIAHEIAHGVFNLRHSFSHENRHMLSEGTTDNLLDYNGGTALYKYQWDLIHDPEKIWFAWLEEEGEGEMVLTDEIKKNLIFKRLYEKVFIKRFSIKDFWTEDEKLEILRYINSQIFNLFYIKNESGKFIWDYARFCSVKGIDRSTFNPTKASEELKKEHEREYSMANYIIKNYSELLLKPVNTYQTGFNEFVKYFYDTKKTELGDNIFKYTWFDNQVREIIDPRTYYKNGNYDFKRFENDIKEYILLKNSEFVNPANRENETKKLTEYYSLLSMYGEYMYRIGIREIPKISSLKIDEIKSKFYNYWELTEIQQYKYFIEWRPLSDARWERGYQEWLAKLRGAEALRTYLEAVQAGKVQAIKDIVIGTGGVTISGIVIGTSEFTFGLDLAVGLAGMGYSLDRISGGISKLNAINNKVFYPNKEYRLVKGIIVDNYGTQGAALYDIGSLIVNVYNIAGTLTGTDLNQVLDYLSLGMDSYEIIEFIESKLK